MKTNEFQKYFDLYPQIKTHFRGTFSIDKIPRDLKIRQFLISNTEESFLDGQHWFCIFKSDINTIEIFDSLGINDENLNLYRKYFHFKCKYWEVNESPVQPITSDLCGYFCVYFIFHRVHNFDLTLQDVLEDSFETNLDLNNTLVENFCRDILEV